MNRIEKNVYKYDMIVVLIFLLLITFKYPLMFIAPFPSGNMATSFYTSDLASLSLFSIFMIFLKYKELILLLSSQQCNKISASHVNNNNLENRCVKSVYSNALMVLIFSLIVFFIVVVIQFFQFENYRLREFAFSLSWIIIPFSIYLYSDIFKKVIIPYFSFLWCFSLIHTIWQLSKGIQCVGVPANRNWHGCFLVMTTPFLIYGIYKLINIVKLKYKDKKILLLSFIISSIIILFTLFALYKAESRGANIALILGGILIISLNVLYGVNKKIKKLYFSLMAIFVVFMLIFIPLFWGSKVAEIINHDVRLPLWRGAVEMFLDHATIGVGSPSYEGSYAYYMPVERFFRSHYFAGRANHPHNQLLYYFSSYGLCGGLALFIFCFYPIIYYLRHYNKFDLLGKLIGVVFIMTSFHGLLDLILVRWPTIELYFILQGVMWGYVINNFGRSNMISIGEPSEGFIEKEIEEVKSSSINRLDYWGRFFSYSIAFFFLMLTLSMIYNNLKVSYYSRVAKIASLQNRYIMAMKYNQKAIDIGGTGENLYDAGMESMFWFNDYILAYQYFLKLEEHPSKIVVHSNARIADCLIKMNRKDEALKYFKKEVKAFPLSSLALHNQLVLERELGQMDSANRTASKLIHQLKMKGLKISDMKKIIADPNLDNRYHLIE